MCKQVKRKPRNRRSVVILLAITVGFAFCLFRWSSLSTGITQSGSSKFSFNEVTLNHLICCNSDTLQTLDIAAVNLACSENLPGTIHLDSQAAEKVLDTWATRVRVETEKYFYKYRQDPASFNNSEAYFRILTMITVLQQDFGVRYNPSHIVSGAPEENDIFFADSSDLFLHGILGSRHMGTCTSMPVLYVALGRRLGYPLKLVTTRCHLFARWEDKQHRFNIEGTNQGLNTFPDEYYTHWPFELSQAEIQSGRYLRSLTPKEELALLLQTRGMCLKAAGRFAEARVAWEKAKQLAPDWTEHEMLIASVSHR